MNMARIWRIKPSTKEQERSWMHPIARLNEYGESEIIRPDTWGGYTIKPNIWEFWQGRKNRTHDRFRYEKNDGVWDVVRLAP